MIFVLFYFEFKRLMCFSKLKLPPKSEGSISASENISFYLLYAEKYKEGDASLLEPLMVSYMQNHIENLFYFVKITFRSRLGLTFSCGIPDKIKTH